MSEKKEKKKIKGKFRTWQWNYIKSRIGFSSSGPLLLQEKKKKNSFSDNKWQNALSWEMFQQLHAISSSGMNEFGKHTGKNDLNGRA